MKLKPKAKPPTKLTYARAGGPPLNWASLEIVEGEDARPMADVIEVDCEAGWCRRYMRGPDGKLLTNEGALVVEFVEGDFAIRVRK